MGIYAAGDLVLIGTDPNVPGLAGGTAKLFQTVEQSISDPTGSVEGTDPDTVTVTYGWFSLVGTVWTQQGATVTAIFPAIGTPITRTMTGGYTMQIDTTGQGGMTCEGKISGVGAVQVDQPFRFRVTPGPTLA